MNEYSVYLENESCTCLPPIVVEEGARRVPKLDAAAGFAVVDGELHLRHCGKEGMAVRILRKGRVCAVRPGQSYRVMPGDSLCVANREYRVREVWRKERPKRSSLGRAARSIALGAAAAAAMLVGCNTNANRATPETAPVVNVEPDRGAIAVPPAYDKCAIKESPQDQADCCMGLPSDDEKKECCEYLHKYVDKSARCEVAAKPSAEDDKKPGGNDAAKPSAGDDKKPGGDDAAPSSAGGRQET